MKNPGLFFYLGGTFRSLGYAGFFFAGVLVALHLTIFGCLALLLGGHLFVCAAEVIGIMEREELNRGKKSR